jgi:hypothetical protein
MNDRERMLTEFMTDNLDDVLRKIDLMRRNIEEAKKAVGNRDASAFGIACDVNREIMWTSWNVDITQVMRTARDLDDARRTRTP